MRGCFSRPYTEKIIFLVSSHNVIWNLLVNLLQVFSNSFKSVDKAEINDLSDQTVERGEYNNMMMSRTI